MVIQVLSKMVQKIQTKHSPRYIRSAYNHGGIVRFADCFNFFNLNKNTMVNKHLRWGEMGDLTVR